MKKKQSLLLTIPDPCHQNWDDMPQQATGKYCNQCNKVLTDFSIMTDAQLLQYFKNRSSNTCGRFLETQLNREIRQIQTPSLFASGKNVFAAFVTIVALQASPAFGQKKEGPTITNNKAIAKNNFESNNSKFIVSGTIITDSNKPLENAEIKFDSLITHSDKEGKFNFVLNGDIKDFHHLYFSFEGLSSEVRSYHPAMGSTSFDIQLLKPSPSRGYTMGVPPPPPNWGKEISLFAINSIGSKFNDKQKLLLNDLIADIKENPFLGFTLIANAKTNSNKLKMDKQLIVVRQYLIDNGIAGERISTKIENGKSSNMIYYKME